MALSLLKTGIASLSHRRVALPPKTVAPIYQSAEFRAWRQAVIDRAGGRCEAMIGDKRCWKAAPRNRMFADHIVELREGGAPFDVENGQCLCGAHHTAKTAAARAARR